MYKDLIIKKRKIALVGLGYVGLPIAMELSKHVSVIGFDINEERLDKLRQHLDPNGELERAVFEGSDILFTSSVEDLREASFYIIAVPTPIDQHNEPDLNPLLSATRTVAGVLEEGDYVVYESTVYPGCTEEDCVPLLEKLSGLKAGTGFKYGYSPERINPGDKIHTLQNTVKIISGCDEEAVRNIYEVYSLVVKAGLHIAPSIKVAEAAKIIENTQRDVNIALMNELAKIFNAMGIDTGDVIEAAKTKWNFIDIRPGLVGGHCISVDPYYLIQRAKLSGVLPRVMTEARRINDSMGDYVANQAIKLMNLNDVRVKDSRILLLGFAFKENCPDTRNTKVIDIYHTLAQYTPHITIHDPWVDAASVSRDFGIDLQSAAPQTGRDLFDCIILCTAHDTFKSMDLRSLLRDRGVIYDVKGVLPAGSYDRRL